jgi:hypothetical protein
VPQLAQAMIHFGKLRKDLTLMLSVNTILHRSIPYMNHRVGHLVLVERPDSLVTFFGALKFSAR